MAGTPAKRTAAGKAKAAKAKTPAKEVTTTDIVPATPPKPALKERVTKALADRHKDPFNWFLLISTLVLATGYNQAQRFRASVEKSTHSSAKGLEYLPVKTSSDGDPNQIRIITRSADTGGAFIEVEETAFETSSAYYYDRPGSSYPHSHRDQNETITAVKGSIILLLRGWEEIRIEEGASYLIPKGAEHTWWLDQDVHEATVRYKLEPAGVLGEKYFESASGFTRDYGALERVPMLQVQLWSETAELDFPFLEWNAQVLGGFVGWIGKFLGYKAWYPEYSTV